MALDYDYQWLSLPCLRPAELLFLGVANGKPLRQLFLTL